MIYIHRCVHARNVRTFLQVFEFDQDRPHWPPEEFGVCDDNIYLAATGPRLLRRRTSS